MLVTLTEVLEQAEIGSYGVVAPDFPSLYSAQLMIQLAEELRAPLILSYAAVFKPMMDVPNYARFIDIVRREIECVKVPICLHLDHAMTLDDIKEAIEVGFTSVMIDASLESWSVNLERTSATVELARPVGVSVEAELGHVTTGEGYYTEADADEMLTNPEKAVEFVKLTEIDALAVAIGNVHGAYLGEPKIDFPRLDELNQKIDIPLVLHGSSGIGDDNLRKGIQKGIRKINLYSEIINTMHIRMRSVLDQTVSNPLLVAKAQKNAVRDVLLAHMQIVGCVGKG